MTVTLTCAQAGAQVTPPGGSGSPALTATTPAAPATPFPKSDAVLPAGTRENRWGPFEGRVVDAETGDAIAGAAIVVFWQKPVPELGGGHSEFYDARWAVSDTEGRFTVPRRDPPFITWGLSGAFLSCVAPGYLPYEFTPHYNPRTESARLLKGQIILRLRKAPEGALEQRMRQRPELTADEKLRRYREFTAFNLGSVPDEKLGELTRDINTRRAAMRLPSMEVLHGELR